MAENARLTARQLAGIPNMWSLECSAEGFEYCWSAAHPEVRLSLRVDRRRAIRMQIVLYALIKQEYSKDLRILVDGQPASHRVSFEGSQAILHCVLPAHDRPGATELIIALPATCSPAELGIGPDQRRLGIALREIRLSRYVGPIARLVGWLRRKTSIPLGSVQLMSATRFNEATVQGDHSIVSMNSHLTIGNVLEELDEEVKRLSVRHREIQGAPNVQGR